MLVLFKFRYKIFIILLFWRPFETPQVIVGMAQRHNPPRCTEKQEIPHPFNKSKEGSGSQTILPSPEQLKGAILPITFFLNNHNSP